MNYYEDMVAISTLFAALVLIGIFTIVDIQFSKQVFWAKNVCFGVFGFFGMFLIISGALFALSVYGLWLTFGICFVVGIIAIVSLFITLKGKPLKSLYSSITRVRLYDGSKSGKYRFVCLVALLVLGVVVSFSKFDYFGMGQDQGVYATAALFRVAGYDNIQIDMDSYHALEDIGDKDLYSTALRGARTIESIDKYGNLVGFYGYAGSEYLQEEPVSDVSGFFHGIPNFSALLSISGFIFGISGMWHIHTLFFLVSIALVFLILNYNLKLKITTSTVFTAIFTLSPIVIWTTKSSLTECFTTLIFTVFLFLITSDEKYTNRLIWLPVAVFSFFHASVFVMMPMFVILFIIMYMLKKDTNIIISGIISLTAYVSGFLMMVYTSEGYVLNNYRILRKMFDFLNFEQSGYILLATGASIAATVIIILSYFLVKRYDIKINPRAFLVFCKYIIPICFVYLLIDRGIDYLNGASPTLEHIKWFFSYAAGLTIVEYAFLSGFIILPIILYGVFLKREVFAEKKNVAIVIVFLYCIVIYSTFFYKNVEYNYYFARYLAPFIPIIPILGAVYIDKFRPKARVAISCISLLATLPFSIFIVANKDESRTDWDSFEQIVATIDELDENDVVLVSTESMRLYFLPLEAMTDSIILPDQNFKILSDKLENPDLGDIYLLYRRRNIESDNTRQFVMWRSEYDIVHGLIPPLPLSTHRDDSEMKLSLITDLEQLVSNNGE